jgi:hypothetical protein
MLQKIYVVNGLPLSGKTEFGKCVGAELQKYWVNFSHLSSIDPVKSVLQPITTWGDEISKNVMDLVRLKREVVDHDWDGITKDGFWRKAMSDLKAKMMNENPDLIHGILWNKINLLDKPSVIFVDIREPEYISSFRKFCEEQSNGVRVETILLTSDGAKEFNNNSDARVYEFQYDIKIENPRSAFVDDNVALWFLRCRAKAFVDQEIMEGRKKERFY